jgi:sugar phosphate isomerase/epimerase
VRKIVDDHGLKIICHTFFASVNSADPQERAPGIDAIKKGIETAAILGADKVMMTTPGKAGLSREESRRNYIAALREVIPSAKSAGITFTIENFPGPVSPFVISSDILEAANQVPGLRLTFDNGNVLTGGEDPAVSFERTKAYAVHAHFKDWMLVRENEGMKGVDGRSYRGALIGEGIVDQKSCLRAMKKCGYRGYIDIEYEGNLYAPEAAVRKAHEYLQRLMSEL